MGAREVLMVLIKVKDTTIVVIKVWIVIAVVSDLAKTGCY